MVDEPHFWSYWLSAELLISLSPDRACGTQVPVSRQAALTLWIPSQTLTPRNRYSDGDGGGLTAAVSYSGKARREVQACCCYCVWYMCFSGTYSRCLRLKAIEFSDYALAEMTRDSQVTQADSFVSSNSPMHIVLHHHPSRSKP